MSRTGHKLLAGSGAKDAYEIDQSLMLPDDANAHLPNVKIQRQIRIFDD